MRLTIIGSGNVATILAKRFFEKGIKIVEIYSRDITKAQALASIVQANAVNDLELLSQDTDVVLIALSDKALSHIALNLSFPAALVVHTAGSVSKNVLNTISARHGVLYPVQSIRKEMPASTPIPFLIDGSSGTVIHEIETLAYYLTDDVKRGDDAMRLKLHVAAIFVCNFPNFLYLEAASFCEQQQVPFSILQDLIEETANRIRYQHPSAVFTGPAVRGDMETINKHLNLLQDTHELQQLYKQLTMHILDWKNKCN